jgi:hypothetical protein
LYGIPYNISGDIITLNHHMAGNKLCILGLHCSPIDTCVLTAFYQATA